MLPAHCLESWVKLISLCVLHKVCCSKQKAKVTFLYALEDHKMLHQFMLIFSRLWHAVWLVGNIVEVCVCVCFLHFQCITSFSVQCSHPLTRLYSIITKKTTEIFTAMEIPNCKLHKQWRTQEGHTVARHLVGSILLWKPGSVPVHSMWDMWRTKWHQDGLFSEHFGC
jgi:D-hexose-6-phosphate mutarotase